LSPAKEMGIHSDATVTGALPAAQIALPSGALSVMFQILKQTDLMDNLVGLKNKFCGII